MTSQHLDDGAGSHSEDEHCHVNKKAKPGKHGSGGKPKGQHSTPAPAGAPVHPGPSRTRPTNNQLLYKAHFRLPHMDLVSSASVSEETDACPSVASCFLQVLQTLSKAEQHRVGGSKRNVLQMLSTNTRRTKVVELSSGTHRIPDELKRNYLADGAGGQYSTNLDRNRYGSDDCYLHTVIRYDLEFLGLCPCSVDVEIIDSKAGNASTLVRCGIEGCTCSNKAQLMAAEAAAEAAAATAGAAPAAIGSAAPVVPPLAAVGGLAAAPLAAPPGAAPQPGLLGVSDIAGPLPRALPARRPNSPQRSTNSGSSGLFDALVMPGQAPAAAPLGAVLADAGALLEPKPDSGLAGLGAGAGALLLSNSMFAKPQPPAAVQPQVPQLPAAQQPAKVDTATKRRRPPPQKSRSRLWSMLSQGELDSIQNALDEYMLKGGGLEDDIMSGQLQLLPGEGEALGPVAVADAAVKPGAKRKPPQSNNSFMLMGESTGGFSGLSKLGLSFLEGEGDDGFPVDELAGRLEGPLEDGGETGVGVATRAQGGADDNGNLAKHHRPVARQFTVSSISPRAAVGKMVAEVEALKAENQRLKQAAKAKSNGPGSSVMDAAREFELEQQLMESRAEVKQLRMRMEGAEQREQQAQERARVAEERTAALTAELTKSRMELNALLGKLSGSSMQLSNSFDQFLGNKANLGNGTGLDLASQLALLQTRRHESLMGNPQAAAMLGHGTLAGQGSALSALQASQLGMGLPLGHSR